jgi:hypothetical protein
MINNNNIQTPIGEMDMEQMKYVISFFEKDPCALATSKDLGCSGAFLTSLVRRGYLHIAGTQDCGFIPIGDGLYKKGEVNVYALSAPLHRLKDDFVHSVEHIADGKNRSIQETIMRAESRLREVREMLEQLEHFK